jgi:hypothetical protein
LARLGRNLDWSLKLQIQNPYKAGSPRADVWDKAAAAFKDVIGSNKPTPAAYGQLQEAYDFFNKELFKGELPQAMLAQHRHPRSFGYWAPKRWESDGEQKAGELGLNPEYLKSRALRETLATLVHEQCHVWQSYFGDGGRSSYHDKKWAAKMESVGLMPSVTGEPGGPRTGAKMDHYIIEGGPFDVACSRLIGSGFKLTWACEPEPKKVKAASGNGSAEGGEEGEGDGEAPEPKSGKRTKFVCPTCEAKAWGKDTLLLKCGACDEVMEAV